jgi:hypothetical protein
MTLTTPIAYLTSYFPDPFQNEPDATFGYYSVGGDGTGSPTWLLFSPGPDEDWDMDWTQLRPGGYDANYSVFAPYTYDPTNGTYSGGDVWRLKQ